MRKKLTEEEIAAKRQLIINTALSLLMKEDYKQITIRQITAACGMATGTFFNYFPSKETLFLHLLYDKSSEYYLQEIERLKKAAPDSFDSYARFLLDGAKDVIDNRKDLISLFIMHYEILSSAAPEHVPDAAYKKYMSALDRLTKAVHEALPTISYDEALRHYSFFHAQLIGARHIAPISVLGSYSPALLNAHAEVMNAYQRYLAGTKEALSL